MFSSTKKSSSKKTSNKSSIKKSSSKKSSSKKLSSKSSRSSSNTIDCSKINEMSIVSKFSEQLDHLHDGFLLHLPKDLNIITSSYSKGQLGEVIDSGSFNKIYKTNLSTDICKQNDKVVARVSGKDFRNANDDVIEELENSIYNVCLMSKKKIHPKVYDAQVMHNGKVVIVMENYPDGNLRSYMRKIRDYPSDKKEKLYNSIAKQCSTIIDKIVDNELYCVDIKPGNIVVKEVDNDVDIRFIDFDADLCVMENTVITKKSLKYLLALNTKSKYDRSKYIKLFLKMLLANHFYLYNKANIMSKLLLKQVPNAYNDGVIDVIRQIFKSNSDAKLVISHYFSQYDDDKNYDLILKNFFIKAFFFNEFDLEKNNSKYRKNKTKKIMTRNKTTRKSSTR
jgi:hypothetical protein